MPKHIKIMKHPTADRLYVSDACDFGNITDLVQYYQTNTLGLSFPGVDTTLKYPYKEIAGPGGTGRHFSVTRSHTLTGDALADFVADGVGQLSFQVREDCCVCVRCFKSGSQYDAGATSVTSVMSIMEINFFSLVKFLS